jgi:hypothetical protein
MTTDCVSSFSGESGRQLGGLERPIPLAGNFAPYSDVGRLSVSKVCAHATYPSVAGVTHSEQPWAHRLPSTAKVNDEITNDEITE